MKPYYKSDDITIYHGDSVAVLHDLQVGSVDLILTDPPYKVSKRAGAARAKTTIGRVKRRDGTLRDVVRDFGKWDHDWQPESFTRLVWPMLRPGGALIAFTSEFVLHSYLTSTCLDHRALLFWRKSNPAPNFRRQIVRAIEMAVWQTKGGGWTFNAGGYRPNVWEIPTVTGFRVKNTAEKRWHRNQKPERLIREWIEVFSHPGDIVLDPFMGSGTTLKAARDAGRRAIGIDISAEDCATAVRRLEAAA